MNTKTYLRFLMSIIFIIFLVSFVYVMYFVKYYPLPITDHISLDAKVKFVRDHIDPNEVDTLIVGSSIGLNNIQGVYLERDSDVIHKVLNFSVYGATTLQVEQLLALSKAFPHLKRIIYSAQYSDFPHEWKLKSYNPEVLRRYMRHDLNPLEYALLVFRACRNLLFCYHRQKEWIPKHMQANKFEYLGFDSTGSVPLHIYGKDIISHRWRLPQPGIMSPRSFDAVGRMAKYARTKGIHFYLVHQPYRMPLYEEYKSVRDAISYFDAQIKQVISPYYGILLSMQQYALDDRYFSDRTHLNDKGSKVIAQNIAKMIDNIENSKKDTKHAIYTNKN